MASPTPPASVSARENHAAGRRVGSKRGNRRGETPEVYLASDIRRIDAPQLKAQLHDGGEIALRDAREEGVFARRHLLLASCVPLGRLELLVDDLVPRRSARVVWCDDEEGLALRAAERMSALGYQDVAVLDGGIAAWEAAAIALSQRRPRSKQGVRGVVEHEAARRICRHSRLKD